MNWRPIQVYVSQSDAATISLDPMCGRRGADGDDFCGAMIGD